MKKYKAIVSDFDGTLACSDKTVSQENLIAINELFSSGKKFALSTGRMTTSALMLAEKLPFKPLIATYNGGEIVDSATGEILTRHVLEPDIMLELIEYGRSRGLYYQIFTNEVIVEKKLNQAKYMLEHSNLSVSEIAQRCGFSSSEHLRSVFHRAIATSPQAYRKNIINKKILYFSNTGEDKIINNK